MNRETCLNLEENRRDCGCSYPSCDKKGKCCECIRYHRSRKELPGCLFKPDIEMLYDRSARCFTKNYG